MLRAKDIVDRFDSIILAPMMIEVIRSPLFLFIEVQLADVFRY